MIWDPELVNTHCKDNSKLDYCQDFEGQFPKFIWIITDGFPYIYAEDSIEFYEDHAVTYTVDRKSVV